MKLTNQKFFKATSKIPRIVLRNLKEIIPIWLIWKNSEPAISTK